MKKKILIADDEKNIRIALEKALSNKEYDLDFAIDGEEVLEKVKSGRYELILMDVQMPKKTGVDVLNEIRDLGIFTKVIMMTAYGTIDIAVNSMKLGAVDFISKPFTLKNIKSTIEEAMNTEINVEHYLIKVREFILNNELDKAKLLLKESLRADNSNAAIQNLFGIIEEKCNNKALAQKYYRAALALDATYKPADNNLKRTAMYSALATGLDLG